MGGVGGAILLGGIAIVCWRIWGRKRSNYNDYDDVRSGDTAIAGTSEQKVRGSDAGGLANDESHMNRYAGPQSRPNAAANF